jgi:hypothetical protein
MPNPRRIWIRRAILMLIVGLVVAIPVTLIVRGDDDEEPAANPSIEDQLPLHTAVQADELKASYQVPDGWTQDTKKDVLTLRSADRTVRIGLAAPAAADESDHVLSDALTALKGSYESVEINPGSGREVGGLPAEGAVVHAEGDDIDLDILVTVMSGKERAYLVEVFTAADASPRAVAQAQQFLNSLKLNG